MRGAALATILAQAVSAAWVVGFLCSRRSGLRLHRVFLRPNKRILGRIAGLGVAPFIMQSTESLVTVVLNTGMQTYGGDLYVGSITIMQSVMQMIVMPVQGITQGTQPIMSYNYGAQNYRRVHPTFKRLLTVTLSVTCSAFLLVALLPGLLARIFTPEPALIDLVSRVMPLFFGGIWAFGAQMACQSTFMALGQAKTSLFLALLRKVILLVPLALDSSRVTGSVFGIYAAEPIADILASATTLTLFLSRRKRLLPERKNIINSIKNPGGLLKTSGIFYASGDVVQAGAAVGLHALGEGGQPLAGVLFFPSRLYRVCPVGSSQPTKYRTCQPWSWLVSFFTRPVSPV